MLKQVIQDISADIYRISKFESEEDVDSLSAEITEHFQLAEDLRKAIQKLDGREGQADEQVIKRAFQSIHQVVGQNFQNKFLYELEATNIRNALGDMDNLSLCT